jgi:cysteine-rich repeat protein
MTHRHQPFRLDSSLWPLVSLAGLLFACNSGPVNLGDRGDAGDGIGGSSATGATGGSTAAGRGSGGSSSGLCGDGVLQQGEGCDDGNTMGGDGCSATCTLEAGFSCPTPGQPCVPATTVLCGDAIVQAGEQCDFGSAANLGGYNGCTPNCTWGPHCGDGVLQTGEGCDDGNTMGGDGCSATCTLESGFRCPTPGQPCVPLAGCASRTESTCNTDCAPIYAYDPAKVRSYVGCQDASVGCATVMTCGYPAGHPESCMLFSSSCVPSGWTALQNCADLANCPSPS